MKISAVFDNRDAADAALARLKSEGITVRNEKQSPKLPQNRRDDSRFMLFPSAYEPYQAMFPYEVPHLNPCVVTPPDKDPAPDVQTVLSFDAPEYAFTRARDLLVHLHGSGVSFF